MMEAVAAVLLAGVLLVGQLCGGGMAHGGGGAGFSVEFIHRDSARSPLRDPSLSVHDRLRAALRRPGAVLGRRSYVGAAPTTFHGHVKSGDVVSPVIFDSFEYLMAVNVGTPPLRMLGIADTGSDLVWVNCAGKRAGAAAPTAVSFDPSGSPTYGRQGCQTDACKALDTASCDADAYCRYEYAYADGSKTGGVLSTETFTFDDGENAGHRLAVPKVSFGCSTVLTGSFQGDGLVGLGGGALSLVSQLGAATSLGRKFSYCLVPYNVNASSELNFGSRADVTEPGAVATPLVASEVASFYTVSLESVKVAGKPVATHQSNIIVDSGTTLTYLDEAVLTPVVHELSRSIKLPPVEPPEKMLRLCYDVSGAREGFDIPDVTLELGAGAAVTLRSENTFTTVQQDVLCLALVAVTQEQPVSILGNIAQTNFHVGYDLDKRAVTFAAADCAKKTSSWTTPV